MDVRLAIIGGKANKSRVSVELPTVIGRSREAGLTVAHPMISRKHCELYEVDGLVMIRDLGSLNGLFVGGLYHDSYFTFTVYVVIGVLSWAAVSNLFIIFGMQY